MKTALPRACTHLPAERGYFRSRKLPVVLQVYWTRRWRHSAAICRWSRPDKWRLPRSRKWSMDLITSGRSVHTTSCRTDTASSLYLSRLRHRILSIWRHFRWRRKMSPSSSCRLQSFLVDWSEILNGCRWFQTIFLNDIIIFYYWQNEASRPHIESQSQIKFSMSKNAREYKLFMRINANKNHPILIRLPIRKMLNPTRKWNIIRDTVRVELRQSPILDGRN